MYLLANMNIPNGLDIKRYITPAENVLTQFKKSPIILECYSSRKNKTFLVYLNLQCCYENPCTLLRRKILRPA